MHPKFRATRFIVGSAISVKAMQTTLYRDFVSLGGSAWPADVIP